MTLVDNVTVTGRPIGLRMRPDLVVSAQRHGGERFWAIKDPVTLQYFHLRHEEYTILTMLDGRTSIREIQARFAQSFAPRVLDEFTLHGFLAALHRDGLVLSEGSGQGQQMLTQRSQRRRRAQYQALLGPLAVRFRGANPQRLLDWLYPKCGWLFSPWCVTSWLLLACGAALLVTVQFEVLRGRIPEFRAIVAASNLPWLILTMAVTKMLHELGHASACRRFGGDCHEIGVMLLVFVPCLYCNVSDSWMLNSKWQRIAVAAAGMYVELMLATIATFLWWWSAPGLFNSLCLNVMVVCSLGTLLFNGNPLLRYDGYYILSDLVEIPNLSAQATSAVRRSLARWCLGIVVPNDRIAPPGRERLLWIYAIASIVYRWAVVIAIFWGLREMARPYHLEPVVALLACLTVVAIVWPAVSGMVDLVRQSRGQQIVRSRATVSLGLLVAGLLVIVLVRMPMRVSAPLVVEYRGAERIYVPVPGTLVEAAKVGRTVQPGQLLARLDNPAVRLDVARLTSERDRQQLYLDNLESQRLQGVSDGAQLPAAKAELADIIGRLSQVERDATRLSIVAPIAGTVLPPPNRPRSPVSGDTLNTWSDVPMIDRNLGTYLDRGTLLCLVGQPGRFEAVLHVEQSDIELVANGQPVRMVLDHRPGEVLEGRVVEIAKVDLKVMPRELAAARDVPARTDQRGTAHPLNTWYQVRVQFDEDPSYLLARVHGRAKIAVTSQSIAAQCARYVRQAFSR